MKKLTATILASAMVFSMTAFANEESVVKDEPVLISATEESIYSKLYTDYITSQKDKFMGADRGLIATDLTGDLNPEIITYKTKDDEYAYIIDRVLYVDGDTVKETNSVTENNYFSGQLPDSDGSKHAGIFRYGDDYVYVNFASQQKISLTDDNGTYILSLADDSRKMIGEINYDDIYYRNYRRLNIAVINKQSVTTSEEISTLLDEYEAARKQSESITTTEWAAEDVKRAEQLGLIPENLAGEDLTIAVTREEFAAIAMTLYKKISDEIPDTEKTIFKDIENSPYKAEIELATCLGVTTGTSLEEGAETFSPNRLIERQDLATMFARLYKKHTYKDWTLQSDKDFPLTYDIRAPYKDDLSIADYAKEAVYFMASRGVVENLRPDFFEPKFKKITGEGLASREHAIVMALRAYENLFTQKVSEQ